MLPPALSETLCSLTAGEDKLTFSTVFTMSKEGRVLSTWFGKTVINSKVKLAYSNAQDVIDGKGLPAGKVVGAEDIAGVEADILMLAVSIFSQFFCLSFLLKFLSQTTGSRKTNES